MRILAIICALIPCALQASTPAIQQDRDYQIQLPGIGAVQVSWSAEIERGGKRSVLASADVATGKGKGTTILFPAEEAELLLRLGCKPGSNIILAQAGVRNLGKTPLFLVNTTPVSAQFHKMENPAAWLISGMHPQTPRAVTWVNLHNPLNLHECGGVYRRDGVGFFWGPAGTPTAYLNARFTSGPAGEVAMEIVADMSGVQVDPGETRWGQEIVLVPEAPTPAITHWVDLVAASHKARTKSTVLMGWNNGNSLTDKPIEQELMEITKVVSQSEGQLRLGVIQIEKVNGDPGNLKTLDAPWVPESAQRVAAVGARFGIRLGFHSEDQATMLATVLRAKKLGFNYLKIERPLGAVLRERKNTDFEALREEFSAIRGAVGEDVYLSYCDDTVNRAVVGMVDASRLGRPARRENLRSAIDDVLLGLPLCGRWFAADFDNVYMGTTWLKNESQLSEGFRQARMWLSLAGMSGATVLTSDPLYKPDFIPDWENINALTPPTHSAATAPGLLSHRDPSCLVSHVDRPWGRWTLALLWNPTDGEKNVKLDFSEIGLDSKRSYAIWGYWENRLLGVVQGSWLTHRITAPDFQFLRLTELDPQNPGPTLVGSNLHISCGAEEIKSINAGRSAMSIELTGAGKAEGDLFVHSCFPPILKNTTGCLVEGFTLVTENIWRIRVLKRDLHAPQFIELAFFLPLTQQIWFWISIVTVVVSMLIALWRYIFSLRLQRQQGLAEERARIAHDLHDDLGASLAQIAYHGDSLLENQIIGAVDAGHIEKMRQIARTTTRNLDEIVWAVDPKQDTMESFAGYLCGFAQEILSDSRVKCRFDLPSDLHDLPLSSKKRHHIFLAFKEALLNVIRHAAATEVRIRLVVGEKESELKIVDNGRGFDPSAPSPRPRGGRGLTSLRDRMRRAGGRCEVTSSPGAGTQLLFIWFTKE